MGSTESSCSLGFYTQLERENYDLLNIVPFYIFYLTYQLVATTGMIIKPIEPLGQFIKLEYNFYRSIYYG